jgi:multiple sugar transport system permease protein
MVDPRSPQGSLGEPSHASAGPAGSAPARAAAVGLAAPPRATASLFRQRRRFVWSLIAPAALVLLVFQVLPIVMGVDASLRAYSLTDLEHPFVGFKNFRRVLTDAHFRGVVLVNTFTFMLLAVAGGVVLGLGIALLLNRRFWGRSVARTAIVFPLMVAPVVASIMIAWIFNDQFGIANVLVTALGFEPIAWLVSPRLGLLIVILTDVWLQTPFYVLIILAALQTMPREPHEAARVDGANAWQVFRNVTLPLLRPVLLVAIVIRSIDAFRVFDTVWTITKGEPGRATEVFSIYAYKEAFVFLNFGMGAASSLVGAVIIMVVGWVLYLGLSYVTEVSR